MARNFLKFRAETPEYSQSLRVHNERGEYYAHIVLLHDRSISVQWKPWSQERGIGPGRKKVCETICQALALFPDLDTSGFDGEWP